jgi:hypothetical protein
VTIDKIFCRGPSLECHTRKSFYTKKSHVNPRFIKSSLDRGYGIEATFTSIFQQGFACVVVLYKTLSQ